MTAAETSLVPEDEVISWFDALSNWGRWGADDELGTLNHLTAEAARQAAASVTEGQVVSCRCST